MKFFNSEFKDYFLKFYKRSPTLVMLALSFLYVILLPYIMNWVKPEFKNPDGLVSSVCDLKCVLMIITSYRFIYLSVGIVSIMMIVSLVFFFILSRKSELPHIKKTIKTESVLLFLLSLYLGYSFLKLFPISELQNKFSYTSGLLENKATQKSVWQKLPNVDEVSPCSKDLFGDLSNVKHNVWVYAENRFSICSLEDFNSESVIKLSNQYEIMALIGGVQTELASEGEVATTPRQIEFGGAGEIKITHFLSVDGPQIMQQKIECDSNHACSLKPAECLIKSSPDSISVVNSLADQFKKSSKEDKIKIWQDYFYDGQNLKNGEAVFMEAIIGNPQALEIINADIAADGGVAETVVSMNQKMTELKGFCTK